MGKRNVRVIAIFLSFLIAFGTLPFNAFAQGGFSLLPIENADFENGTVGNVPSGWTASGAPEGKVVTSDEFAYSGSKSMKITKDSAGVNGWGCRSVGVEIVPGTNYCVEAMMCGTSNGSTVYLEFWNGEPTASASNRVNYVTTGYAPTASWEKVIVSGKAPANATHMSVLYYLSYTDAGSIWVDDVTAYADTVDAVVYNMNRAAESKDPYLIWKPLESGRFPTPSGILDFANCYAYCEYMHNEINRLGRDLTADEIIEILQYVNEHAAEINQQILDDVESTLNKSFTISKTGAVEVPADVKEAIRNTTVADLSAEWVKADGDGASLFSIENGSLILNSRPTDNDTSATLTLKLSSLTLSNEVKYTVNVKKYADANEAALDTLTFDVIKGENTQQENVKYNLNLVATHEGKTVTWTSSNTAVIAADGKVTQPIYWGNTTYVKLTATIGSHQKSFNIIVNPARFNQYTALNVENGNFEVAAPNEVPNWTRMEGTLVNYGIFENSTEEIFEGNYSLKLDDPKVGLFNGGTIGVKAGHRYVGEILVKGGEGSSYGMLFMFFDMSSYQVGYAYASAVATGGDWKVLRAEATAPAGAVMARVYPMINPSSAAPTYFDCANIYEIPLLHNAEMKASNMDATWFASSGKLTSTTTAAFEGVEYAFTGNTATATTVALNFYNKDGAIIHTYTKDVSGDFDVRAISPAGTTAISVTLGSTDRNLYSNLALNLSQKGTQVPDGSFETFGTTGVPSWSVTTTVVEPDGEGEVIGGYQLFPNGDFETETLSGWNPTNANASITRTNEKVASGNYSAKIVTTVNSAGIRSDKVDIVAGKEYTIGFKAQTTEPSAYYYIEWWDASDTRIDEDHYQLASASEFKEYTHNITAPRGAVKLSFLIYFLTSPAITSGTVYLDDVFYETEVVSTDKSQLMNEGFESGSLTSWEPYSSAITIERTTDKAASGSYSAKVVSTGAGLGVYSPKVDVVAGKEYTIGFKAQTTDETAFFYLRWWDSSGALLGGASNMIGNTGDSFKEISQIVTAPANAVKFSFLMYFIQPDQYHETTGRTIYIDDVFVKTDEEDDTDTGTGTVNSSAVVNGNFATDGANGLTLSAAKADSFYIPVLSGKDYTFLIDTKSDTVGAAKATITYYDYTNNVQTSETVTNTTTGNETLKLTTKAPTKAFNATITLETETVAYFDNARIYMVANTIGNPSFENTNPYKPGNHATQWQSWGGTIVSTYGSPNLDLPDGVFGLEIKGTTGGSVNSSMIRATAGVDYTARVKASSKQGGSFRVSFYDANFGYISSSNATAFSGEEWTGYSANGTAPSGTAYAVVEILASAGDYVIVDNTEFFTTTANIGDKTQLLIDDYIIADVSGIDRTFHQAEISDEPVMQPTFDGSSSHSGAYTYGTMLYDEDEKIYKLWYQEVNNSTDSDYTAVMCAYATSVDGVNWEQPNLGVYEYNGSKDNNLIGNYHLPSVFKDYDETDPNKRYKMITYHHTGTHYSVLTSPDGITWNNDGKVFSEGMDVVTAMFDKTNNQYVATVKWHLNKRDQWTVVDDKDFNTVSYVTASTLADLIDAQNCYRPDSYGQGMYEKDGVYVGFDWLFSIPGTYAMEGPVETYLTFSRDLTDEWQRPTRTPIIPLGVYNGKDMRMGYTTSYPIEMGDEIWLYTSLWDGDHAINSSYPQQRRAYLYIAKWRMDGFASLDSGNSEGVITTRPLAFDGTALKLNADASKGAIRVELLDASGNPISGYTKADCDVITTDSISHTVSWGGKKDISALKNSGVSLKIYSENSDIYSFEFGEPTKSVYTESETEDGSKLVGSVVEGDEFELPESTYTKEGYAFKGWKVSGSDEILKPGDKVTVEDDMTLTAVWNLYGDFDGNDKVDAKETSMVREYLIGKPDAEFIKEFADVNTDGDVDICDLVVFIKNLK